MTPEQELARASNAKRITEDPLFIEAMDLIEQEIIQQWEVCPARDAEGREFLWMYYKNARKFRGILQGIIESGKLAAHSLNQQKSFMAEQISRFKR